MCGFAGLIRSGPEHVECSISEALPFLRRRGPDSSATWQSDDNHVALLHTRLSIVDQDTRATQPLVAKDLGLVVVFNGEIYNHQELRKELCAYPFQTDSDTEVILAAYVRYGLPGLNLLRGMYSFAIIDTKVRRIYLVRDPVGKKPLFILRKSNVVAFGSSVLALLALENHDVKMNTDALASFWSQQFVSPDQCIVENVVPVSPGAIVELDWTGRELARHSHSPSPILIYDGEPFETALDNTRGLLRLSIERRLSHNPVPTSLLSGGIDSTLVTSIAAEVARDMGLAEPLKVFTLGSLVPLTNDEPFARYAAIKLGIKLEVVRPQFTDLAESLHDCVMLQDEPMAMLSFFPLAQLVSKVSDCSRILLTGDGGDEVFLGYGDPARWLTKSSRRNQDHLSVGPPLPQWMSEWGVSMATNNLVGHGFTKTDRASAEQGVEIRCPLLDWDLMAYARSLPPELLMHGGVMKALLKQLLGNWPNWFLERRKMGFVFNLRWQWGLIGFAGLREMVLPEAAEHFALLVPQSFRKPPMSWRSIDIFRQFDAAWTLYVWSAWLRRLALVARHH